MSIIEKIKAIWNDIVNPEEIQRDDQQHVMSEDEKIDQSIDESFPASDSPAHHNYESVNHAFYCSCMKNSIG